MQKNPNVSPIRKALPAVIAALSMSAFIFLVILALGLNALFNQNVSVAEAATQPVTQLSADRATIQNLQAAISQYQARESQYQSEMQQAATQINQISQQNQEYQQLIQALQEGGVIQITPDGRVIIPRSTRYSSDADSDDD